MPDVHLAGISGPFGVAAHGVSKVLAYPCAAPPRNGRAAVWVHSSHQDRLHDFDDQAMDNAVRPERNDLQLSLLLAAVVIDRLELWPGRHIASVCENFISLLDVPFQVGKHFPHLVPGVFVPGGFEDHESDEVFVEHLIVQIAYSFRHNRMIHLLFRFAAVRTIEVY